MGTGQTGRVRADEHLFLDLRQGSVRQARLALADVDGAIGQTSQHGQTVEESLGLFLMISSALAASGLVSMAVTKMARGWNPRPAPC